MTRKVKIGNVTIGGGSPIAVQSMLNVPAGDVAGSVAQARALEAAGCDIIRAAVPDREAVRLVPAIKAAVSVPLVADIHFDYRIALDCVAAGVDKIRLNPGNIGGEDRVKQVADACRAAGVPIRIGVNSGSLEKHILAKYGAPTPQALVDSALYHARLLEKFDFTDVVVSIKSSHVPTMIEAYRLAAKQLGCPLHLGVTEAGTARMGLIKSAVGIGSLLCDGIGDTIRVSLTADPGRGGARRARHPQGRGQGQGAGDRLLPDLRAHEDRPHLPGGQGGGGTGGLPQGHQGRGHGLRRQRAGRSAGSGHRHRGRKRGGASLQEGGVGREIPRGPDRGRAA